MGTHQALCTCPGIVDTLEPHFEVSTKPGQDLKADVKLSLNPLPQKVRLRLRSQPIADVQALRKIDPIDLRTSTGIEDLYMADAGTLAECRQLVEAVAAVVR